jgi:hypothetical protein
MFLRQLANKELDLFLKFSALVTAIDKPTTEVISSSKEVLQLERDIVFVNNNILEQKAFQYGINGENVYFDARQSQSDSDRTKAIQLSKDLKAKLLALQQVEALSGFNADKQTQLFTHIVNHSNKANAEAVALVMKPIYADYHALLLTLDEDVDEDIPNSSEADYRFIYGTKLSKRYIKETDVSTFMDSAKRMMVYDLYSIALYHEVITPLQDKLVKKIAGLLGVESNIISELKTFAESIHATNVATQAVFAKENLNKYLVEVEACQ